MAYDNIVTLLELSCLFNIIMLVSIVGITRSLEARELEVKSLKRKIQGIKETLKKL